MFLALHLILGVKKTAFNLEMKPSEPVNCIFWHHRDISINKLLC